MEEEIYEILNQLGILKEWKGYKYWTTAIIENIRLRQANQMENLQYFYSVVGGKHKATTAKVESSMRYAFEQNKKRIMEYLGVKYNITVGLLLQILTDKVCHETTKTAKRGD